MKILLLSEGLTIGETLKGAMFPEKVKFFGAMIDPTLAAAFLVTFTLLLLALLIRIFVIPKFTDVPKPLQMFLEALVNFFDSIAKDTADKESGIVGCYIFTAALYICFGTLVELFGIRPIMSSVNTCVAVALCTYLMLLFYGIKYKGVVKGLGNAMKEITVPVSMTFRLFGSVLSGFLIMELVYHFIWLRIAAPAILSVMFTLFHAFIQSYIFAMLSSLFIGEAMEKNEKHQTDGLEEGMSELITE